MQTVLMAIAVIKRDNQILLRRTDPSRNPYKEPWALFGGRITGSGSLSEELNKELSSRWNMTVRVIDRLWWDEDQKVGHDGEEKHFIYLDVLCELNQTNEPVPANNNEQLQWVGIDQLQDYELNPPTRALLTKLGYTKH